jgi:hypothetical protein
MENTEEILKDKSKKYSINQGRTKEWDSNDWQGRSERQVNNNNKLLGISSIALFILLLILLIFV